MSVAMTTSALELVERSDLVAPGLKLYLLARPAIEQGEIGRFLGDEQTDWRRTAGATEAEEIVEFAGRICYLSFGSGQSAKDNRAYIEHLVAQEHDSVLEHASWTFLLTGVSRAFTHQMVRHRVGFSYSQLSQQYHDEAATKFVMPEEIKANEKAKELWLGLVRELREGYGRLAGNLGVERVQATGSAGKEKRRSIRSSARSILPNSAETKIVFSANGRSLRHFLRMRGAIEGDLEMRMVCDLLFSRMSVEAPALFVGFERVVGEDGYPMIHQKAKASSKAAESQA